MNNKIKESFEVLEVPINSTLEEVNQARRDLWQVWHPDKHPKNERLQIKSTEKLKRINAAYDLVKEWFVSQEQEKSERENRERSEKERQARDRETAERAETECRTRENAKYVKFPCPHCGTINRVLRGKSIELAKCGECRKFLIKERENDAHTEHERWEREASEQTKKESFQQNIDPIYIDPQTGLMWARNANIAGKRMSCENAMMYLSSLNYGDYSDWRLPTKSELRFLKKRGGTLPSKWFNANGFNNVQARGYWSSTRAFLFFLNTNIFVDMADGFVGSSNNSYCFYVWPVRDGR